MNMNVAIEPILAIVMGILILLVPRFLNYFVAVVTSHYPQVAAARIKSDNGGILLSPNNLSLR